MQRTTTRLAFSLALAAVFSATPLTAWAAPTTTTAGPTSTTTVAIAPMKLSAPVVSLAWKTWRTTWIGYLKTLKVIDKNYRASIASARSALSAALKSATSTKQRAAARANFNAALTAAISSRVTATVNAGDPPLPPPGFANATFVINIDNADIAYRAANAAAQTASSQALLSATTSAQRDAAHATLQTALNNAIITRSAILLALGVPPRIPGSHQ